MQSTDTPQGIDSQIDTSSHSKRPTFGVTCWLLALLAFAQLLTVGAALAIRQDSTENIKVASRLADPVENGKAEAQKAADDIQPRSLAEILAQTRGQEPGPPRVNEAVATAPPVNRFKPPVAAPATAPWHAPTPAVLLGIKNPRVERLVQESRHFYLEGDMVKALLKLDEAGRIDATECAVIYQKGLLFEEMDMTTKAAGQYQRIQQMGLKLGGEYFSLAVDKLSAGMTTMEVRRNTIAIGPMKVNRKTARQAEVAITLLARPDQTIQSNDVEVQVHFYDRVNDGSIKKSVANSKITPFWEDAKVDWLDVGNEETLRVSYDIPRADFADEHLLGRREFYGCVVVLIYKGEVIDQQAYPRRLHSIHSLEMLPKYTDPSGFPLGPDDGGGLLPHKELDYGLPAPLDDLLPSR